MVEARSCTRKITGKSPTRTVNILRMVYRCPYNRENIGNRVYVGHFFSNDRDAFLQPQKHLKSYLRHTRAVNIFLRMVKTRSYNRQNVGSRLHAVLNVEDVPTIAETFRNSTHLVAMLQEPCT